MANIQKQLLIYTWTILLFTGGNISAQINNGIKTSEGWSVSNPFEQKVFIENNGQFTEVEKNQVEKPILYYNRLGKIHLYFTASSLIFRYDSISKPEYENDKHPEDPDFSKNVKVKPQFLKLTWQNASPDVEIEVQTPASEYYTYNNPTDASGHSGITAHAFKKLIYHNLYKGIDVEFNYLNDKQGIEYTVRVHPGANLSEVKMVYSGNAQIVQNNNNIYILSLCANLIDHAPAAKDGNGNIIPTSFSLNNNVISFRTANYDKTQTLTIDPWITSPGFSQYNMAYDIDYDNQGNVYIGGGEPPYSLNQYDKNGNLNWSYTTPFGTPLWWGSFTTDVRSGSSYIVRGLNGVGTILDAVKISSAGNQLASYTNQLDDMELWRVGFDYCNNKLIIAAGLYYQVADMDTNLTTENKIVLISNPLAHDMSLMALDNQGSVYLATNASSFGDGRDDNVIFKLPLSSLPNPIFSFSDYYSFRELVSLTYYPPQPNDGYSYANGFNGMAANKNMLVTYDGALLKKWNTNNGALLGKINVSGTPFQCGGLDIDCQDNIYAGNNNIINVYDSNLNLLNSIQLSGTVYALKFGNGQLYACGNGFVQSINLPRFDSITPSFTIPSSCNATDGTATAYPACGSPPYTYIWSNGQTTQAVSGLGIGSYSVIITDGNCMPFRTTDTINLSLDEQVFVPNVFTPNGDGINDILYAKSDCITTIDFEIFNRWGNKVFKTENINNGWDGIYNGKPLSTGTYFYYLKCILSDGTPLVKKGCITLIR